MKDHQFLKKQWWRFGVTALFLTGGLGAFFFVMAATGIIDPNGDGTVQGTPTTCGGAGNYTCVDDAVRSPTAPSTAGDYVTLGQDQMDYYDLSTLSGVTNAASMQVFVYHQESATRPSIRVRLYDATETTSYRSRSIGNSTTAQWDSVNLNNLNLTQAELDGAKLRLECRRARAAQTCTIYAAYAVVTYSGSLGVDIVDGSGASVTTPSVDFSSEVFSWAAQQSTGVLGIATEKVHLFNDTTTATWDLTLAATDGPTALWDDGGTESYDFNGAAAAGRLEVDPSSATITPESGCTTTGVTSGSAAFFAQGTLDSVTLASADATADTECYWDITGIDFTQDIPAAQPSGTYTLDLTLTAS